MNRKPFCNFLVLIAILGSSGFSQKVLAQNDRSFARRNSFGIFAAYSNSSSHMLLGEAGSRKLLEFGISYSRRLFMNHAVNWQYDAELLPVAIESDPLSLIVQNQTTPVPRTFSYSAGPQINCNPYNYSYSYKDPNADTVYTGSVSITCSDRRWTFGEAISPIGFRWNFLPHRKIQPFLDSHGGYMFSTRPIPIDGSGSFNFTFDLGAGAEFYRSSTRSVRAEFRYHHISNHDTAHLNPGIDNGLVQISYCFGR